MPTPQIDERAVIVIEGQEYSFWTAVVVERTIEDNVSTITLQTYESSPGGLPGGWSTVHLMLGMPAQAILAGQLALTGVIDTRQVVYAKEVHEVQIRVGCLTTSLSSTMDPKIDGEGGQFVNQTFAQIAKAVGKPINLTINVVGNPPGADEPFDRVQVALGQTRHDFLAPLAAMRHLHSVDDEKGNLNFFRASDSDPPSGFSLKEGENILEARAIMRNDVAVLEARAQSQQPGSDDQWGAAAAQIEGVAYNRNYAGPPRPFVQVTPHTGTQAEAQMYAESLQDFNQLTEFSVDITVQGWLAPDGNLWIMHIRQAINVYSPMILPLGAAFATLFIKGVKHLQSSEQGTITILSLCLPNGLGAGGTLLANQG